MSKHHGSRVLGKFTLRVDRHTGYLVKKEKRIKNIWETQKFMVSNMIGTGRYAIKRGHNTQFWIDRFGQLFREKNTFAVDRIHFQKS